jgi:4-hydroxy-3-methylbut-2-enyl diphosphate reductase
LIDGAEDLQKDWFENAQKIGVTAGASAPELLVLGVVEKLKEWGGVSALETQGTVETITFSLPKLLRP